MTKYKGYVNEMNVAKIKRQSIFSAFENYNVISSFTKCSFIQQYI